MRISVREIAAVAAGTVALMVIAGAGFIFLRTFWPDYAAAEPHKAYTLAMLFSRLAIGVLCIAGGACVSTAIAADKGQTAWWFGAIFFSINIPDHIYPGYVWNDYPAWYHVLYLSYIIPVAGLAGRLFRGSVCATRATKCVSQMGRCFGLNAT